MAATSSFVGRTWKKIHMKKMMKTGAVYWSRIAFAAVVSFAEITKRMLVAPIADPPSRTAGLTTILCPRNFM